MDPGIKFLLDYNKSKAINTIRNAQAVVWCAYGLFFATVKLINLADSNTTAIELYSATFTIAVFYYLYVLMKYHEYNDKINMYLIKYVWETSQMQSCSKKELVEIVRKKLLLSEKNISKAIVDLSEDGFFRTSTTIRGS